MEKGDLMKNKLDDLSKGSGDLTAKEVYCQCQVDMNQASLIFMGGSIAECRVRTMSEETSSLYDNAGMVYSGHQVRGDRLTVSRTRLVYTRYINLIYKKMLQQ